MSIAAACIAAAACVLAGCGAARRLAEREKTLSAWEEKLIRMESEARRGGAALPALLREGSAGEADALRALADRLEADPAADAEEAIRALPWPAAFSPEEKAALTECLPGLFAPEKESQLRALQRAGEQWRRFALAARESREKNAALYRKLGYSRIDNYPPYDRKLGWLAGAAVFILLC